MVYVPQYFRVVRASTLEAREATYIEAARAMGARPRTIIRKYLFGNVVQSVPVIATLNAADAILTLAGLGFLGLGIQPDEAAEWGYDLQRAVADAGAGIWWTALFPGLGIVIAVTALTLVGEGLNDVLNPTLRRRNVKRPDVQRRAIGSSAVGPATRRRSRRRRADERTSAVAARPAHLVRPRARRRARRRRRQPRPDARRDRRPGRRVGLRQVDARPRRARPAARRAPATPARSSYKGRNILDLKPKELRELRGPELGMIFQEPMTRLNPLMKISAHFEEVLKIHEPELGKKAARQRARWRRCAAWASRRRATTSTRTSSRAACASGS